MKRLSGADKRRRRAAVIARDGNGCAMCGTRRNLTLDHVIPLAHGGSNRIENLQLLCRGCNKLKGAESWVAA